jgi:ABC-type multidrug transport system fused ATPase/permease subunit
VNEHPLFYVGVYSLIGLIGGVASLSSSAAQYTGALRASRQLFNQLLVGVVHATMRWHDTTPQGLGSLTPLARESFFTNIVIGRLLNRFGKDIETIDGTLAGSLQAVNSSLATFLAAILTVV